MIICVLLLSMNLLLNSSDIRVVCIDGEVSLPSSMPHDSGYTFKTEDVLNYSLTIKNQCDDADSLSEVHIPVSKRELESILPLLQLTELAKYDCALTEERASRQMPESMESLCTLAETAAILDIKNIQDYVLQCLSGSFQGHYARLFFQKPTMFLDRFKYKPLVEYTTDPIRRLTPDLCGDLSSRILQAGFIGTVLKKKAKENSFSYGLPDHATKYSSKLALLHGPDWISIVNKERTSIFHIDIASKRIEMRSDFHPEKITDVVRLANDTLLCGDDKGYLRIIPSSGQNTFLWARAPISLLAAATKAQAFLVYTGSDNVLSFISNQDGENRIRTDITPANKGFVTNMSLSALATHYSLGLQSSSYPEMRRVALFSSTDCYKPQQTFDFVATKPIIMAHNPRHDGECLMTYNNHKMIGIYDFGCGIDRILYKRDCDTIKKLIWSPLGNMFSSIERKNKQDSLYFWDERMQMYAHKIQRAGHIKNFTWNQDASQGIFFEVQPDGMHCLTHVDTRMLSQNLGTSQSFIDQCLSMRSLDTALLLNGIADASNSNHAIVFNEDTQKIHDAMDDSMKNVVGDFISGTD